MGLRICLEDEKGERLSRVYDTKNLLYHLLPFEDLSYQCLRFGDFYGDTVFNRLQMETLLEELARLKSNPISDEERALIESIKELAQFCRDNPHFYIKFYGD